MADITKPKKQAATAPAGPRLVIPKRSVSVPVAAADENTPASEPIAVKRTAKNVQPSSQPATEQHEQPAAPQPADPPADPAPADDTPNATMADLPQTDQKAEDGTDTGSASARVHPQVRKALEDAKRQQEIQQHIENRDFFVPVNAVARKRSIKVSAVLILVELVLGMLLLNLMLDAGLIELLYKIPHTNFFDI